MSCNVAVPSAYMLLNGRTDERDDEPAGAEGLPGRGMDGWTVR